MSPSGKHIRKEIESKQNLTNLKLLAMEDCKKIKMPKHVQQFQGSPEQMPALLNVDDQK